MQIVVDSIGPDADETFSLSVKVTTPDGQEWYSKSITTVRPVTLEMLEIMISNCRMVAARKMLEYVKVD